jgi:hypothetical protein
MQCDRRLFGGLLLASAVASFAATGCSDIKPNDEVGSVQDSTAQEAEQFHQMEERQEENRQMGGGGGGRR